MPEDRVIRVLIVCIGNVCRSPLTERLLAARLAEKGLSEQVTVTSAGVRAMVGRPMEPLAADQLSELGGDPAGFEARQLETAAIVSADLVLTATTDIRSAVLLVAPTALRRTFTIREFAALVTMSGVTGPGQDLESLIGEAVVRRGELRGTDLDIPDPMGRSIETHAFAATLAATAVEEIAAGLADLTFSPT